MRRDGAKRFHLNPGGLGFYRVRYDGPLLDSVLDAFPTLPPIDRWAILTDLYAFVLSGDATLEQYFRFVAACRDSTDYLVVHEVANQLASIRPTRIAPLGALLFDTKEFQRDGLGFFRGQVERLGLAAVDGEPDTDGSSGNGRCSDSSPTTTGSPTVSPATSTSTTGSTRTSGSRSPTPTPGSTGRAGRPPCSTGSPTSGAKATR